MSTTHTAFARLRLLVPAALVAAAVLGVGTPTASAAREWDIGQYESCVIDTVGIEGLTEQDLIELVEACCLDSGGDWNADRQECVAPPHPDYQRPSPPRMTPPAQTSAPLAPGTPTG
jgi:hypothetical protein